MTEWLIASPDVLSQESRRREAASLSRVRGALCELPFGHQGFARLQPNACACSSSLGFSTSKLKRNPVAKSPEVLLMTIFKECLLACKICKGLYIEIKLPKFKVFSCLCCVRNQRLLVLKDVPQRECFFRAKALLEENKGF